ncbi:hypothetical protein BHE74_00026613, partial [Ensete ventricosum]
SFAVTAVDSGKRALELLGLLCYRLPSSSQESSELKEIPVVIMSSENVPNRITRLLLLARLLLPCPSSSSFISCLLAGAWRREQRSSC